MEKLEKEIIKLLNSRVHPNEIDEVVEDTITTHGKYAKWGNGKWYLDRVCSICGSNFPRLCRHKHKVIHRSEYEAQKSSKKLTS